METEPNNSNPHTPELPMWEMWRQDENGQVFWVDRYDSLEEATERRDVLEKGMHKQTYWLEYGAVPEINS